MIDVLSKDASTGSIARHEGVSIYWRSGNATGERDTPMERWLEFGGTLLLARLKAFQQAP